MDDFFGYQTGLFINKSTHTPAPNFYSFSISDNIYSAFPKLILNFIDSTGLFLDLGNFTQGVPLNIKYGVSSINEILDVDFRSSSRDAVSPTTGAFGLNGVLNIKGLHESFFKNRKALHTSLKEMLVSDAVRKLFPAEGKLKVETTKGKIESYAFEEPYIFTREVLLPQATNGKIRPFVFFRNLLNELHFESINLLENASPSEKLSFGDIEGENAHNTFYSFLPYNEGLNKTFIAFSAEGRMLKNDLNFEFDEKSVATDAKDKIPVIMDSRICNDRYFHRQFNPKVEYDQLNTAFFADAMKAGFFVDKAIGILSFHPNLVAGKTVEIIVSVVDSERKTELSETFSSNWLIEQSHHSWNGQLKRGQTQLVFCRSSMKPRRDSIIMDKAFKD